MTDAVAATPALIDTTVADTSAEVDAMRPDIALGRALLGGTRTMRALAQQYLPQWPNESDKNYQTRIAIATLFPAYKRTVAVLTGKPFGKKIVVDDKVPPRIAALLDDVDLRGHDVHVFAAEIFEAVLGVGSVGILVDVPPADGAASKADGVATQADEDVAGIRPYCVKVDAEQVLGWRSQMVNGRETLTQLRIMELVEEPDGEWAMKKVRQVRVLTPGHWQTWRQPDAANKPKEWALFKEGITTLKEIPFVAVHGDEYGFMQSRPPLIELAYMNVEHFQSASDQQTILHVARVPVLVVTGIDDDTFKVQIGANSAVTLPVGASMAYVEHTGKAIEAGESALDKLEERMRQAGAEMLVVKPQRITAFQVGTENELAMSELQRIVQDFEDAFEQVLDFMADWLGLPEGRTVSLFKDFNASNMAEASAQFLVQAATAGKISDETLFNELQRRGMISADIVWADEKDRLDAQGPTLPVVKPASPGNMNAGQ